MALPPVTRQHWLVILSWSVFLVSAAVVLTPPSKSYRDVRVHAVPYLCLSLAGLSLGLYKDGDQKRKTPESTGDSNPRG